MISINPKELSTNEFHSYLLGAVAPRPIAFASTVDASNHVNLSPFSFFNVFGSNPPILVFSPSNRVRDNSTKHTLDNVLAVPEVVINMVDFALVEQMSLASTEYAKEINEFEKAGLTEIPSMLVKPPRVKEAPVAFECKVLQVLPIGQGGGSANLVICEVVMAHIQKDILDDSHQIDPVKFDAVARMGGNWYCRATSQSLFEIPKPLRNLGIGVDQIPDHIKNSSVLTGNNLGRLGNVEKLPDQELIRKMGESIEIQGLKQSYGNDKDEYKFHLHALAKAELELGNVEKAWLILLQ
jgi:flavin reductase (DIM6/NTAB) family NADH-FMN oxidoreductase RutF